MKVTCKEAPRVFISPSAKEKLDLYLRLCDKEISGLGCVEKNGKNFIIDDILLFTQEVTGGSTDIDDDDVANYIVNAIKKKKDPSNLRVWWHSHVNGSCFWSGTDEDTAGKFNNEWMISIVGNKRGEYNARLDLYSPARVTIDDLQIEVRYKENPKLVQKIKAEIIEKVREKVITFTGFVGPLERRTPFKWPDWNRGKSNQPRQFIGGREVKPAEQGKIIFGEEKKSASAQGGIETVKEKEIDKRLVGKTFYDEETEAYFVDLYKDF